MKRSGSMLMAVGLVASLVMLVSPLALAGEVSAGGVSNGKIVFSGQNGDNADIYIMDADGANPVNITTTPAASEHYPEWSPDGTQLALSIDPGSFLNYRLFVMNADGSNVRSLSDQVSSESTWSPDGQWIAFNAFEEGANFHVFKVRVDGTDETVVLWDSRSPAWSPDGERIALTDNGSLSLVDPDGLNREYLSVEGIWEYYPSWSPDGTKVAFEGNNFEGDSPGVWVINEDGSNPVLLVADGTRPVWSPDGSQILFGRGNDPFVVPATGGTATMLANWSLPAGVTSAGEWDWQPVLPPSCRGEVATIWGTDSGETLTGTAGDDVIVGLGGADTIYGNGGADVICAGPGPDTVYGGTGRDKIYGQNGADTLYGNGGADRIEGGLKPDTIKGGNGNDKLFGGRGGDTLRGGNHADTLFGNAGTDRLGGDGGSPDVCNGGVATDTHIGGCETIISIP